MEAIEEEVGRQVDAAMKRNIGLPEVCDEDSYNSDGADVIGQINRAFAANNVVADGEEVNSIFCNMQG